MRADLPHGMRLSAKEHRELKEENDAIRHWIKLACVVLHNEFGFGHDRIVDFLRELSRLAGEAEKDEVFWKHIDDVAKMPFYRENYEEMDK